MSYKNTLEIVFSVAVALLLYEFVQIVSVAPFGNQNFINFLLHFMQANKGHGNIFLHTDIQF